MKKGDHSRGNLDWSKQDDKLVEAVDKGSRDEVHKLVVKKKVNPTKVDPTKGLTSLHLAVCEGKLELVNILLSSQTLDIDVRDFTGRTALHCAARNAEYEISQALLQKQASVALVDHELLSVLHHACLGGHLGCVQLLLSSQAPVYMQDRNGRSALAYAAWKGQASVCRLLIENGADVNDVDCDRRSPLMLAAEKGNAAVCDYLINKGADISLVDKSGHDALWLAQKFKHIEVVRVIEQALRNLRESHDNPDRDSIDEGEARYASIHQSADEGEDEGLGAEAPREPRSGASSTSIEFFGQPIGTFRTYRDEVEREEEEELDLEEQNVVNITFPISPTSHTTEDIYENEDELAIPYRDNVGEGEPTRDSPHEEAASPHPSPGSRSPSRASESGSSRASSRRSRTSLSSVKLAVTAEASHIGAIPQSNRDSAETEEDFRSESIVLDSSHLEEQDDSRRVSMISGSTDHIDLSADVEEKRSSREDDSQESGGTATARTRVSYMDRPLGKFLQSDDSDLESVSDVVKIRKDKSKAADDSSYDNERVMDFLENRSLLQKEMNDLLEEKRELMESCTELERKLSVAMRKQHWLHEELCELQVYVKTARSEIDVDRNRPRTPPHANSDQDLIELLLATSNKMLHVQRRIETLIRLETEFIEEVDIYANVLLPSKTKTRTSYSQTLVPNVTSASTQSDETGDVIDTTRQGDSAMITKLEQQNKSFLKQLRQAQKENKELQEQMNEVEKMIILAKELKDENMALIADYNKLRDMQDEENKGLEELEVIFRDTTNENNQLITENDKLKAKLVELEKKLSDEQQVAAEVRDTSESDRESSVLLSEINELKEAVSKQSATIEKIDETMRESSKQAAAKTAADEGITDDRTDSSSLSATASGELRKQLEKVTREYDELTSYISNVHSSLDNKNSEIFKLNQQILNLSTKTATRDGACQTSPTLERRFLSGSEPQQSQQTQQSKVSARREFYESVDRQSTLKGKGYVVDVGYKAPKHGQHSDVRISGAASEETSRLESRAQRMMTSLKRAARRKRFDDNSDSSDSNPDEAEFEMDVGEDYKNESLWIYLQQSLLEAEKVLKLNMMLKERLKELSKTKTGAGRGGDSGEPSSAVKNLEMQRRIEELEQESTALRRTISEQSRYLLQVSSERSAAHVPSQQISSSVPDTTDAAKTIPKLVLSTPKRQEEERRKEEEEIADIPSATSSPDVFRRRTDRPLRRSRNGYKAYEITVPSPQAETLPSSHLPSTKLMEHTLPGVFHSSDISAGSEVHVVHMQPITSSILSFSKQSIISQAEIVPSATSPVKLLNGKTVSTTLSVTISSTSMSSSQKSISIYSEPMLKPLQSLILPKIEEKPITAPVSIGLMEQDVQELKAVKDENANLRNEVEVLRKTWVEYDDVIGEERKKYSSELNKMKRDLEEMTEENFRKSAQIDILSDLSEKQKSELGRVSEIREQCSKIMSDYEDLLSSLSRTRYWSEAQRESTRKDESEFSDVKACITHLTQSVQQKEQAVEENMSLKEEIHKLKSEIKQRNEMLSETSSDHQSVVSELKRSLFNLQESFSEKSEEVHQLMGRYEDAIREKSNLISEMSEVQERLNVSEINSKNLLRQLEDYKEVSKSKIGELEKELAAKSEVDFSAQREIEEMENRFEEEIWKLKKEREELRKERDRQRQETEEVKRNLMENVETLKWKLEDVERKSESKSTQLQNEQETLRIENERLKRDLAEFERDFADIERLFEEEREESSRAKSRLEEELKKNQEKEIAQSDISILRDSLIKENDSLKEELDKATKEREDLDMNYKRLQQRYKNLEEYSNDLENENTQVFDEKNELSSKVDETQRNFQTIESSLKTKITDLESRNAVLLKENEYLMQILEEEEALKTTAKLSEIASRVESTGQKAEGPKPTKNSSTQTNPELPMRPVQSPPTTKDLILGPGISGLYLADLSTTQETAEAKKEEEKVGEGLKEELKRLSELNDSLSNENKSLKRELTRSREKPFSPVITWSIGLQTDAQPEQHDMSGFDYYCVILQDPEFSAPPGCTERCIGGTKKYRPSVGDFLKHYHEDPPADQLQYQLQDRPQDQPQQAVTAGTTSGSTAVSTAGSASENQVIINSVIPDEGLNELNRIRSSNRDLHVQALHLQNFLNESLPWSTRWRSADEQLLERYDRQQQQQQQQLQLQQKYWQEQQQKVKSLNEEHIRLMNEGSETERLYDELIGGGWGGRGRGAERRREISVEDITRRRAELLARLQGDGEKLKVFVEKLEAELQSNYQPPAPPTVSHPWSRDLVQTSAQLAPPEEQAMSQEMWRTVEQDTRSQLGNKVSYREDHQDIICSYRRHLLASVQDRLDPKVREALLKIVQLRQRHHRSQ